MIGNVLLCFFFVFCFFVLFVLWIGTDGGRDGQEGGVDEQGNFFAHLEREKTSSSLFPPVWLCKVCFSHVTRILCSNVFFFFFFCWPCRISISI